MAKWVKIDEIHVSLFVPPGTVSHAARRTLSRPAFPIQLRAAVRKAVVRFPSLNRVRVTVSR